MWEWIVGILLFLVGTFISGITLSSDFGVGPPSIETMYHRKMEIYYSYLPFWGFSILVTQAYWIIVPLWIIYEYHQRWHIRKLVQYNRELYAKI